VWLVTSVVSEYHQAGRPHAVEGLSLIGYELDWSTARYALVTGICQVVRTIVPCGTCW
jgi:hypothetical protein